MQAFGIISAAQGLKHKTNFYLTLKRLSFAFKTYFMISLLLWCYQLYPQVSPQNGLGIGFDIVIFDLQIWRIFTSIFHAQNILSLIGLLACFFLLMQIISIQEKAFSTVYVFVNIYLSMLILNGIYLIISALLAAVYVILVIQLDLTIFQFLNLQNFISGGWWTMLFYQVYRDTAKFPNATLRIFELPCTFKNQFYPWIIGLIFLCFTLDFIGFLSALFLGWLQGYILKDNLIKLPLQLYKFLDKIYPKFIKKRSDFYTVQKTLHMLKYNCFRYQQPQSLQSNEFFNQNQLREINSSISEQQMKKSSSDNPKDFWIKKQEQMDKIQQQYQQKVESQKHASTFAENYQSSLNNQEKKQQQIMDQDEKRRAFWLKRQEQMQKEQQQRQKQEKSKKNKDKKKDQSLDQQNQ